MLRSAHARVALPLLLLLHPIAARASITPEAQAVVERYMKAVGGREAVESERSLHLKGTISAFGLAGSIESWTQRPDRSASVTTIGPFTIREAVDGAAAWRVDQNGKFTSLDGKDLEDARASAYFENDLWVTPDQGGAAITKVQAEHDSAGSYAVLEVAPPVGRPRRLWFAEKTGLLDRVVSRRDQQTVTDYMYDYRTVSGRKRPHGNRLEIEGMPMNTARLTLDSVWVNPAIEPSTFAAAKTASSDTRFRTGPGPVTIPMAYQVRHVWLKAAVDGGAPAEFLLDTGASITVIDSAYAAQHGLKTEGQIGVTGAGAAGGASFASVDSIVVPGTDGNGVVVTGQKVAVLALNPHLEPFFWRPIAGVLGYDFISRFVMTVDYDRQTLRLRNPAGFHYEGNGAALPMTMAGNIPVVKARLDGDLDGEFRLDVGSGSTVDLHTPFVKNKDLESRVGKTIDVLGGGFGGTFTSSLCRMKRFQLGKYSWDQPLAVLSRAETGGLASEDYAGNIGNHVLERFVCTFDYEHRMVYLEPGRRIAQRDQFSLAGFQMAKFGDEFTAMQVLTGSAADKAGLRSGDRVLAIDGKPVTADRGEELRAMFEDGKPGTRHTLEIEREGRKKKLNLTLAEML